MIKCEMHCHSKGGSICAKATSDQLIEDYINAGYGAVVLTNHYSTRNNLLYPDYSPKDFVDLLFRLIYELKEKGEKKGLKVFYGAEVRINTTQQEYMLYGFDEKFMYDNATLTELTQKDLFHLAEKNHLFMYQTHPFRVGVEVGDPQYIHGAESYNGHFHHVNNNFEANEFCEKYNLIKMTGTDYHEVNQPITTAMILPETIKNEQQLAEYLLSGKCEMIYDDEYYKNELVNFKKSRGINIDLSKIR